MSRSVVRSARDAGITRGAGNTTALASELRLSRPMMKRLFLATVLLGTAACEHGVDLEGTVTVPVDVQELFSADAPGQLFVVTTVPEVGEIRDDQTVFCLPQDQDRRVSVKAAQLGCAPAATVTVFAYAIPRTTAQIDCASMKAVPKDPRSGWEVYNVADAVAVASVEARILGGGEGACSDGRIEFSLTLQRPLASP